MSFGFSSTFIFVILAAVSFALTLFLLILENPVFSILLLVVVYMLSSVILIVLNLLFSAFMLQIVYLGALIVLFLFVVMMLNIRSVELNRVVNFFPFIVILISSLSLFSLATQFSFFWDGLENLIFYHFFSWDEIFFLFGSFRLLNIFLYGNGFGLLFLMGLLLLLAMFGAITLTLLPFKVYFKQWSVDQLLRFSNLRMKNHRRGDVADIV